MASETLTHKGTRKNFPVTGMTCAGCAVSVESMLKSSKGVSDAGVNFATQTAWAEYNEEETNLAELQKSLQSVGYDLIIDEEDPSAKQEEIQLRNYQESQRRTIWAAALSVPVVILGMFFMNFPYTPWISLLLTIPVLFWFGRNFFINAWKQASHGKANMDTLVALSTGIAFIFSAFNTLHPEFWHSKGHHAHVYFEAASVIIVFISLGKLLEDRAKSNTSSAIKKLMGLQPKTVKVLVNGLEEEIPTGSVVAGNIIILRPGEKVPVDGIVVSGTTYIDESMITGEPVPVLKLKADKVFAGTVNQKGSLQFKAEKVGSETLLAHIIKMVQEAQGSKAPVQKLVDKVAGIFVPTVIVISILTFITWMFLGGENAFTHALLTSVTVLVIACPCALGLATPTAIMVGIGKGAENNILIKDAESLELAHKVNTVILDKTGTITEGKPEVNAITWAEGISDLASLKSILYSLEVYSEHPLAEAVVKNLKEEGVNSTELKFFESITARGVKGITGTGEYFAGNRKLIEENNLMIDPILNKYAEDLQEQANTVIFFASSKGVLAVIAIADKIKTSSKAAIQALQKMNIEVLMLTGDNAQTAAAIAKQAGLNEFHAEVLPSQKADYVKKLQEKGKVVAMVGDGINDSQALAQADVSIAMGKGSDIAMDVAKMTLITSDLQSIPKALKLSRKTVATIRQNLFWAFIYNVIGIPVAAGALYAFNGFLLDPMLAGAAMALSSVSVVSNSLRLKAAQL
ncbi:heavy metal translocating P-type ATPase [Desertivirga arenae]|uniref:heavy metal translocating P-type ATPase n=1 Tax=Desertivirga arenae TaxID=2810309 RepID=UPI001A97CFF0|nr:heavy metal translocating P-type ATPase [Pedobacter sp. SYSU D00823]